MADRGMLASPFKHSKFQGGKEFAAKSPVVEDVNDLIAHISRETAVAPETVHKILSMAQPSTAAFVMKQLRGVPELKEALSKRVTTVPDIAV